MDGHLGQPDPYESRTASDAPVDRPDPVLWGTGAGPLSTSELGAYEARGFLLCPAFFDDEALSALRATATAAARTLGPNDPRRIAEPGSERVRSIFAVHRESPVQELAADPRLKGVAEQILGGSTYVHQSRINFKGPGGRPFQWHSDFETWHVEDGMRAPRALTAVLLLSDHRHDNGPLQVIPGSHRLFLRCPGVTPASNWSESLRAQTLGVPSPERLARLIETHGRIDIVGPAGSVLFFDCNLLHGSEANTSPHPRDALFVVYNAEANRLTAPFGGTAPRPPFLASR